MFTHVKSWCTNFSNLGPSLWDGNGRDKSHLPPHLHYSAMPFGKALACCPFESSSGWKRAGWGILKCISNAMKAGPGHPWQRGNGAEMLSLQMERSPNYIIIIQCAFCSSQPSMVQWLTTSIFPCLSRCGNTWPNLHFNIPNDLTRVR